jgi:hypothetical protein
MRESGTMEQFPTAVREGHIRQIRIDRPPRFVLVLWPLIDRILRSGHHMMPITKGSGAVLVEVRRNSGHSVTLSDGSEIKAGDTILELHIRNNWFKRQHRLDPAASRISREMLVCFRHDLGILARELDDGAFSNCVALHGCTHIGVAAKRLGFQVVELPNSLWKKFARFYISGLAQVYGPRRPDASGCDGPVELAEVWLSKRELLRRYGVPHR